MAENETKERNGLLHHRAVAAYLKKHHGAVYEEALAHVVDEYVGVVEPTTEYARELATLHGTPSHPDGGVHTRASEEDAEAMEPCPFCGGTDVEADYASSSIDSGESIQYQSGCWDCDAVGPPGDSLQESRER
jgi:hypothetical protein